MEMEKRERPRLAVNEEPDLPGVLRVCVWTDVRVAQEQLDAARAWQQPIDERKQVRLVLDTVASAVFSFSI